MVARTNDDKDLRNKNGTRDRALEKKREGTMDRAREIQREFLIEKLDELSAEFGANPEAIGGYMADLEAAGMLSPADKGMLFRRLWETMGPAFADAAFGMTERALSADALNEDIQLDAYFGKANALVDSPEELRRVEEASHVLDTLARALGLSIDTPRPQLRARFDDNISDFDPVRAAKTRELMDVLGPQLGINTDDVEVKADEEGAEHTGDQGLYGLMTDGQVFLDPDIYDPETESGRGLLAHELVHVAQYENRLRGANDMPDLGRIGQAEGEADALSSQFAAGGSVQAPLAALASYDKAACGPAPSQEVPKKPEEPKKPEDPKKDPPREPKKETIHVPPTYDIVKGPKIPLDNAVVHFHVDKSKLSQTIDPGKTKLEIEKVGNTLIKFPEITAVRIEGFTSTTATPAYNQKLSEARAQSVRDGIEAVTKGKSAATFDQKGYGEDKRFLIAKGPDGKVDLRDNKEYVENRRTEVKITGVNGKVPDPDWVPTKEVLKTPGKTIITYKTPDGKVTKTEEIPDGGGPAKEIPAVVPQGGGGTPAPAKTPPGGSGSTPAPAPAGGGGAPAPAPGGGATAKAPTPAAGDKKAKDDKKAKEDAAAKKGSSSCDGNSPAAGGGQPDSTPEKHDDPKKEEGTGGAETPTDKMVFRARVSARRLRRLRAQNRKQRARPNRRFAGPVLRHVGQAKANAGGLTSTEIAESTQSSGGERIPDSVRGNFEQAFGQSFNDVRIHRGSSQAVGIGATAFARGTDIHFAPGRFDPGSQQGLATLGHELTHIVQQRAGRVAVPQGMGTHINVDRSLEAEADLLGSRAARGESVSVQGSSAGLYSRAERGGADMILFEGGAPASTGSGGSAPAQAELTLAGQTIRANMPAGASPGRVQVDFSTAASIAGLTLGQATLEFNSNWEITRGDIAASVSVGDYVRANDLHLTIEQKTEGARKYAEIAAEVRGATFNVPDLFNGTIDLRLATTGITGTATIQAAAMQLGGGIRLNSGTLTVALAAGGAVTASGVLNGSVEGLGDIIVTATGMTGGAFTATVEMRMTQPRTLMEGVEVKAGSVRGTYTHKQSWEVSGNLTVNVRNWVEASISAKYTQTIGAGGGGASGGAPPASGGAPAPGPATAPAPGGGGAATAGAGGTNWTLKGTLNQLQDYGVGEGENRINFKKAKLDVDFANGAFVKTDLVTEYETTNWKGRVTGSFDVQKMEATATGTIDLKVPELAVGAGVKVKKASAVVTLEKNELKQFVGNTTVVFPYQEQDTFELVGQQITVKIPEKMVSGSATMKTLRDLPFGDQASYNAKLKTGATATMTVTDNKLGGASAGLNFDVNFAAEKIGDGKIDMIFAGDPNKFGATAKFTLTAETFGIPDRTTGPVMLKKGGEFSLSIENSALKQAQVKNVKYSVKQDGEGATGKIEGEINGTFDFQTQKLNATGNGALKGDWTLAPADGVSLKFKEGGRLDLAVTDNKLTKADGEFNYEMKIAAKESIPEINVEGKMTGKYSDETKKFGGELTGTLKNKIDIPMGEARADKLQIKEGAKFKATVADSKPGVLDISLDADYLRAGELYLSGHIDSVKYAFSTGELDFKGNVTLKKKIEKSTEDNKWKFVVNPDTQVGVEVEKSKLKLLTGTLNFEVHDTKGALAKGTLTEAKLDVEKLLFSGKIDVALARDLQYPKTPDGAEAPPEGTPPVSIVAKKDVSKLTGQITDNAFAEIGATLKFGVNLGGVEYGQGDVTGKMNMTANQFDGTGKINLVKDLMLGGVERTPGGDPIQTWVLAFPAGQGLDVSVKQNQLDEANINLGCKLFNNGEEVANGTVEGRYKLGKTDGFNGKVDANVIKNLDWSNEGRWHYWIEKGTNLKANMEKTKVTSVGGKFSLLMQENPEGGRDAVRVKFDGDYTPGTGFNAKGDIECLNDVKVGEGAEFKFFVAKGSAGKAEVAGKKVTKLNGDLTLNVMKGQDKFAKGVFKLDYDASNATAKFDATGKVDLLMKTEVGATGDWKFFLCEGTGVDFSVQQNELQWIKGQLNAAAAFKAQECITGNVNVNYTHAGGKKLDADGNITVTKDIGIGSLMSGEYKIDIKPGTGATFDVKSTELKTIGGKIKVEVRDAAPLVGVDLEGTYTHAGTKFDGHGKVALLRKIEVGQSPDGTYKFNILEGTGAEATVADNKITQLKGMLKANVEKEGEFAKIEGDVTATKLSENWKITTVGANFNTVADKELPLRSPEWKVKILSGTGAKVTITDNKLDEISGTIKVQVDKGQDFSAQADLSGKYTTNDGFSGEAVGKLLKDFKVREPNPYGFWALKDGTEAKFSMLNSAVDKIGGKVNFKVTEGADDFIKGSASIDYDLKANNLIEARGDGELVKEKTLGTYSGFTLVAVVGSKANFLAQANELKKIGGELKLRVDEGGSALAEGKVTADFDVKTSNFSGQGKVNLVRDYAVSVEGKNGHGQPESWGICFKKGGGLDVKVKDNAFEECNVDVEAVGYHNGKIKADGKLTGMYKAGNPEGFTGSVKFNVTERVPLYEQNGSRFDYHIETGTKLEGQVTKGSIQSASVTAILIATEGGTDKLKLTGTANYTKGQGVDGALKLEVLQDILVKEASAWKIWLAQGSGGNAAFTKSKLDSVDGTLKLRVDKGDQKFAVGDFTAKYEVKDGTDAKVTAKGTVSLVSKVDITPGAGGDFKVFLASGTGIEASVKDSELDYVSGAINGELHYKAQHMANFALTGKYQSLGTPDFSGTGTLETVKAIEITEFKGYKLFLGKGAGITGKVTAFALDELTANIPLELQKASKVVVKAGLNGTYKHADKKFDGTGNAEVLETITIAENVTAGQKSYSFYLEKGGTGISATITANDLKQLTGTLIVTVSDGGESGKFLKATATATYSAGDPSGKVTANGSLEITRDTEMLTTAAGYSAWLKKGSGATVKVTDNTLEEIGGTIDCAVQKPAGQDFATIKLAGKYTQATGFNGTGEAELKQDYKIVSTNIGAETYSLWVLKGTGANIQLENSDIKHVGGKVNAMIRDSEDAAGDFIKIEATADYDFPGKMFSGTGSGAVLKDKKLAASASGEELWLGKGTGINGTITNNNLQQVGGNITLKLKDTEGFYLEGTLNGSFDAAGGSGFSGAAAIKVTRDKKLGSVGSYSFWLSKKHGGAGASATILKNELTKVDGNVGFLVKDDQADPLIEGKAQGTYDAKTQLFSGSGAVYLGRDVEYPLAGGKLIFKKGSGGGGEVKDNKLEKLTGVLKVDIHDSTGPFVHAEADGEFNAVTKTIVKLHGQARLLRTISVGSPPAVNIKTLQGDVWVENNEVKKIEGKLGVELPSLSKNGAKASGTFEGGWEKTASVDEFWGKGDVDFTVFDKGERYLKGKVTGEYKRDKTFNFAGKLTYQMNPGQKFEVRVAVDQNLDPVVGATADLKFKLADARDLFKWKQDFNLLNINVVAVVVPITFQGGVGVGLSLGLKQTDMSAHINFDGWKPLSHPGDVPDFDATVGITSGLKFKAAVQPWLTFGVGVGGLCSAGLGLKGEGSVSVDLGLNPTGSLWGKGGKYGGSLDLGLQLVGSGELSLSPIAYAEIPGKKWDYEMTKVTHSLGELFNLSYNYKIPFGDQSGAPTKGAAPAKSVPAPGTTKETAPATSKPALPADVGGAENKPGPVKGGPDMNQTQGDKKGAEDPMAGLMAKIDNVQKVAAKIGNIAKALSIVMEALKWAVTIPLPWGLLFAAGYLAYKHFSGAIDFVQVWTDIKDIWKLVQDNGGLQKIMPQWLIDLYNKINDVGGTISGALGKAADKVVEIIQSALPDWVGGAIRALGDVLRGAGATMIRIYNIVKNGISGGISGVKDFAKMLVEMGGEAASVGARMLRDAVVAVGEAAWDAIPW
ncbi:MAG: DUF4157 domain-containing protein [Myxococcota bacterium]